MTSDIKVNDMVVVIKNVNPDKYFDQFIGKVFTVRWIGENLFPGVTSIPLLTTTYAEQEPTEDHHIIFLREELRKIEPLDQDEIERFCDEINEDEVTI